MNKGAVTQSVSDALDSYEYYTKKYLANVSASQLADGLDSFYSDYRNRSIQLPGEQGDRGLGHGGAGKMGVAAAHRYVSTAAKGGATQTQADAIAAA
jgi:hypothetical protein